MFRWNDDKLRWFSLAEDYTKFFKKLNNNIKNYISLEDDIVDIGCGAGILSSYMADYSAFVTGIDIDSLAIDYAKGIYKKENTEFLNLSLEKAYNMGKSFDVAVACQFGSGDENYKMILALAKKRAIFIKNLNKSKALCGKSRSTVVMLEEYLKKESLNYSLSLYTDDFDQVFENKEDIKKYIDTYGIRNVDVKEISDERYKYVIKKRKNIGIVVVDK